MIPPHDRGWREFVPDQPHAEIPYQCPVTFGPRGHHWQGPACENGKGRAWGQRAPPGLTSGQSRGSLPAQSCRGGPCMR